MQNENLIIEINEKVALIRLNRPQALNALNEQMIDELGNALVQFDRDENIGCIVITGNEKAFAAGADIAAMANYSFMDVFKGEYITRNWEQIRRVRKPVIAAVAGYALGGGCELAMMCDFIIAADTAKFGQPEVRLGTVPADKLLDEAMSAAATIASMSLPIAMMIKESINQSYESMLSAGVMYERRLFHSTFATQDQKEGMQAFIEKRLPSFRNL